jgi:hypothetical protein
MKSPAVQWFTLVAACTAWFALVGQMGLALHGRWQEQASLLGGLINFFSYFTVLTNTLVAAVLSSALAGPSTALRGFFRRPGIMAGVTVSIAVVGISYSVLLRNVWDPQGFQWLVNELLHDVLPVAYVLWWWCCAPKDGLHWRHAGAWMAYPLVYFAYAMLRGQVIGVYQYPFINVDRLGWTQVLINSAVILAGFIALSLAAIALGRWQQRRASRALHLHV